MESAQVDPHQVFLLVAAGVLLIVGVNVLAPKARIAAPLILVVVGFSLSLLPWIPSVSVQPEWILVGILPPLLYSSAVSLPTMDFRRDFTAIGALSVVLVIISSVLMGWMFTFLIPDLSLAGGIALGAIISPTDAVATQIVRRLDAAPRVVTMLEGESLLNDGASLVLLRSAIAAMSGTVALWQIAGEFLWAVVGAVGIGLVVGMLGMRWRSKVGNSALSTAISLVVPFMAYLPAERVEASGLVAVVVAGMVSGYGAAKYLRPQDRIAVESTWRTIELLLEGAVFLLMGLELVSLAEEVRDQHDNLGRALIIAVIAAVVVLLLRTAFVAPLLLLVHRRKRRGERMREDLERISARLDDKLARLAAEGATEVDLSQTTSVPALRTTPLRRPLVARGGRPATVPVERVGRLREALTRRSADIDYITSRPLNWPEGALLVWAGMRGVVTLAAAQTLPHSTPHRAFLILIAFFVATGTLIGQGGTLPWVVRRLGLVGSSALEGDDRAAVRIETDSAALSLFDDPGLVRNSGRPFDPQVIARARHDLVREHGSQDDDAIVSADGFLQYKELRLRTIGAQREALLQARSSGVYSSSSLGHALDALDAEQISVEMRRGPVPEPED